MKTKLFKTLAATAMSVLAIACAKEPVADNGQQAGVSFTIEVPGAPTTRAYGEAEKATKLYYQVFDNTGAPIEGLGVQTTDLVGKAAKVSFQLVKDQTYNFVFWAQTTETGYYTIDETEGLKKITADYTTHKDANDENRDAFFATESFKVTGPVTKTVTLKRPFAQINIGTKGTITAGTDSRDIVFTDATSAVTVTGVPTVFKPLANADVQLETPATTVTFEAAAAPAGNITVNNEPYKYLAMNYVFASEAGAVTDITATLTVEGKNVSLSVPNAPIKRNWRTNIVGNLLTSSVDFNVVVDPSFGGNEDIDLVNIKNEASLKALLATGGSAKLADNIDISKGLVVPSGKNVVLNLGGKTIKATAAGVVAITVYGDLEITGAGTVDGGEGGDNQAIQVQPGAKLVIRDGSFTVGGDANGLGNSCIENRGGEAEIYGGTFRADAPYNGWYYVLNQLNGVPGTFKVYGGKFENYDPAQGDDNLGGNFVADGYKSTKVGDYYVVTKKDVTPVANNAGLNTAISGEGTSKDTPITVELTSNTTVTLDNGIANGGDNSRNVTFVGDGTQTVDVITKATSAEGGMLNYQRGSSFTFKNMTIQAGEGAFDGVVCDALTYENCTIKGKLTLYGKATFVNCVFENTMADQYCIWTWGGTDVKFDGCTFNTNGKAILLYGQATEAKPTNLMVVNSIFNDRNNGSAGKAAIEIGNDYNAYYKLTIDGCTVNGFADGKNTGSKLWANKNSMDAAHLSVTIDGTPVL